jgi:hypothetical protein
MPARIGPVGLIGGSAGQQLLNSWLANTRVDTVTLMHNLGRKKKSHWQEHMQEHGQEQSGLVERGTARSPGRQDAKRRNGDKGGTAARVGTLTVAAVGCCWQRTRRGPAAAGEANSAAVHVVISAAGHKGSCS